MAMAAATDDTDTPQPPSAAGQAAAGGFTLRPEPLAAAVSLPGSLPTPIVLDTAHGSRLPLLLVHHTLPAAAWLPPPELLPLLLLPAWLCCLAPLALSRPDAARAACCGA
jgi:hypothetical protein